MRPLNCNELAEALRRHPTYVYMMKKAGYVFSHGNRTLFRHALEWLADNPDFRTTQFRERKGAGKHRPRPRVEAVDRLWVRETFTITSFARSYHCKGFPDLYEVSGLYDCDGERFEIMLTTAESKKFRKWKRKKGSFPSIFMFRSLRRSPRHDINEERRT